MIWKGTCCSVRKVVLRCFFRLLKPQSGYKHLLSIQGQYENVGGSEKCFGAECVCGMHVSDGVCLIVAEPVSGMWVCSTVHYTTLKICGCMSTCLWAFESLLLIYTKWQCDLWETHFYVQQKMKCSWCQTQFVLCTSIWMLSARWNESDYYYFMGDLVRKSGEFSGDATVAGC